MTNHSSFYPVLCPHFPTLPQSVASFMSSPLLTFWFKLMSVFLLFSVSCLFFFLNIYSLSSCVASSAAAADAAHYQPTLLHANLPLPTSGQQHTMDARLPFPYFNPKSNTLFQSLSLSTLPLLLFFFCPHPFPRASTMQSWESTMPLPVSQWPFVGRARGSAHSQWKATAGI